MKKYPAILIIALMFSCTAPTADYVIRDGGVWNIDEKHHKSTNFDTTFTNCGEISFILMRDFDNKKDEEWQVEGYFVEPAYSKINDQVEWIWTTWHFKGHVRDHPFTIGSKITIWNYQLEEYFVLSRSTDKMEWKHTNWEGTITETYKLSRK